ncbi:MAG: VRR-NUC domain-containing protein [Candidatus Gastranaerophilaceae bacterium]|jgi:hypothetical protein
MKTFKVSAKEFNRLSMKEKAPLEKEITKEIRKFLNLKRIFHYKAWQGLGSVKGVADIIGIMPTGSKTPGTFVAIEVKTARGVLSPHQEEFLRRINEAGGIAFVARGIADVIYNLKNYW